MYASYLRLIKYNQIDVNFLFVPITPIKVIKSMAGSSFINEYLRSS